MKWTRSLQAFAFSCRPGRRNPARERRSDEKHRPAQFAPMLFDNLGLSFVWTVGPSRVSQPQEREGLALIIATDRVLFMNPSRRPLARKEVTCGIIKGSIREPEPRSSGRGPIEAPSCPERSAPLGPEPRSSGRGPIEALEISSLIRGIKPNHGHRAVDPLKRARRSDRAAGIRSEPRSSGRGPIEAVHAST